MPTSRLAQDIGRLGAYLDKLAPLAGGSHRDATGYLVQDGQLVVLLEDEVWSILREPQQFRRHSGPERAPVELELRIELCGQSHDLKMVFRRGAFVDGEPPSRLLDIRLG